jgi:hypothetical protein
MEAGSDILRGRWPSGSRATLPSSKVSDDATSCLCHMFVIEFQYVGVYFQTRATIKACDCGGRYHTCPC